MFTCHVTVSVFEDENGCFVDLEGEVGLQGSQSVVDVGLGVRQEGATIALSTVAKRGRRNGSTDFFSRANTPIDFVDELSADHLEENDPGARIQHLLVGGPVRLVLDVCILTWALAVDTDTKVVWLIDLRYSRGEF